MSTKLPLGTTRTTGETCPESGVWQARGYTTANSTIPLAKGNTFPPFNNQGVTWVLKQYA